MRLHLNKITRDFSASAFQVIINQLLSLAIFYFTSKYLPKDEFGEMNWSLAIITTCISIIGFGMEHVIVRKIASGADINEIASLYGLHVFITGTVFYGLLVAGSFLFPAFFTIHAYLTGFAISSVILYFSSPFRQLAHGLEWFRSLTLISIFSNLVKVILLLLAVFFYKFSIYTVILIYIIASGTELITGFFLVRARLKQPLRWRWKLEKYVTLIRDSLPQLGGIIFNSGMARFDWIIIGLLTTPAITAEYSFAYRVFELAAFPLLIIAPVLLPRISRYLVSATGRLDIYEKEFILLLKLEMIVACLIPLVLNLAWVDLLNPLTDEKYGSTNATIFLLLSLSTPFLYLNNFFWTIAFAGGKMKQIISNIMITFLINATGVFILIPIWQGKGAAIAYLVSIVIQSWLFIEANKREVLVLPVKPLIIAMLCAVTGFVAVNYYIQDMVAKLVAGPAIYLILVAATGLLKRNDFILLKRVIKGS